MFQDTLLQQSFNSYFFDLHESPLDSPLTIFCFQRSEAARPEQVFYTKPGCVQYLCEVGHTYTEQGIRSRNPGYTKQGIRGDTRLFEVGYSEWSCGYTEQDIRSRGNDSIQAQCIYSKQGTSYSYVSFRIVVRN